MSLPVRVCFILLFFLGMSCTSKVDLSKGGPPQRPELVFPVTIGTVQEGSLTEHAMLVGSVRWARRISLKSEVSAKVLSCSILEGERFNKNDLLVELDITEYQNEINYLEAQKKKAQESLTRLKTATRPEIMQRLTAEIKQREIRILQTRKELDRIQKLIQNRIVTEDELTKATADYEEAVALLDQSKARYEEAKNGAMKEDIAVAEAEIRIQDAGLERATLNLKRCKVYAPFSGVVLQKHIETNAVVGKEDSFMEIASLEDIELRLEVPESYAMRIPENLKFSFTADAIPGEIFQATVLNIVPLADPKSRNVPMRASIEEKAKKQLIPGMFIRGKVPIATKGKAVLVPLDAVIYRNNDKFIFVVGAENKVHMFKLETGLIGDKMAEVLLPELKPGEQVVTLGGEILFPDAKIQVISR